MRARPHRQAWAVTPEKDRGGRAPVGCAAATHRPIAFGPLPQGSQRCNVLGLLVVEAQVADRLPGKLLRLRRVLRGLLMPIDLIVTSQGPLRLPRPGAKGTVEFAARTTRPVLYSGDEQATCMVPQTTVAESATVHSGSWLNSERPKVLPIPTHPLTRQKMARHAPMSI